MMNNRVANAESQLKIGFAFIQRIGEFSSDGVFAGSFISKPLCSAEFGHFMDHSNVLLVQQNDVPFKSSNLQAKTIDERFSSWPETLDTAC